LAESLDEESLGIYERETRWVKVGTENSRMYKGKRGGGCEGVGEMHVYKFTHTVKEIDAFYRKYTNFWYNYTCMFRGLKLVQYSFF
jgi:hypothetical protein